MPECVVDKDWERTLPILYCPYCGAELKELRIKTVYITGFGWACSCTKFKEAENIAFRRV